MSSRSQIALSLPVVVGAVIVMFLWAICFPLITAGLSAAPPMTYAALRAAIAGGVLLLIALAIGRPKVQGGSAWVCVGLVGLTATSLGFFGMFYGGQLVSPGLATVLANGQPLIAAVLAWYYLDESLRSSQWAGLFLGFIGIVLIATPSLSAPGASSMGALYIMIGASGIAVSNIVLKRMAGKIDPIWAMGWQLLIGSVPLALLAWVTEDIAAIQWSLAFVVNLGVISVVGTSAAFCLWFFLLGRSSLNQLNAFTFLTPIFGLLMGMIFYSETVHLTSAAGIAASLVGIYMVSRVLPESEHCPSSAVSAGHHYD